MGKHYNFNALPLNAVIPALVVLFLLGACGSKVEPEPVKITDTQEQERLYREYNIERGKRLVELGGCSNCHTPKIKTTLGYKADKDKFLSGYPQDEPLPDFPYTEIMSGEAEKKFYTTDATIWAGRWGVSFAANLTPDPETGIGAWQEEDFIKVFREKKHFSQENPVVAPMPVGVYSQLSIFELRSIFIYLQTIPPVENKVPAHIPPESDLFEGADT